MKRFAFPIAILAIVALSAALVVGLGVDPMHAGAIALFSAEGAAVASAEELKAAIDKLNATNDEVKRVAEEVQKNQNVFTEETRKKADENLQQMTTIAQQIADIEQRLAKQAQQRLGDSMPKTAGALFVEDAEVKKIDRPKRGRWSVEVPRASFGYDLRADVTSLPGSAGAALNPYLIPGIVEIPRRRMTIRNLIAQGRTAQSSFKYIKESGFTNNAAVVSETTQKPYSDLTFEAVTGNVSTIAHLMKASVQILADFPALASIIDNRMRYGLAYAEELELLRGDGTGEHLLGIIPQSTTFAPEFHADQETRIDEIRLAMLQVYLAQFPADGIVLHPVDWAKIETTKDSTGRYLISNPQGNTAPRLWGLPVVDSLAMQAGEFLVGAFSLAAQIFDRQDAIVEVSTENDKDFEKNMVTIRAEERLALAVYREEAIVHGTFTSSS